MSRFDSRGNAMLLTVLAVVLIGGFLYWLYWRAQNLETSFQVAEQDTAAEQVLASVDSLAANPSGAAGSRVLFDSAAVGSGLGRAVFTLRLNDTTAYPVLMNPSLIQQQTQLYGGDLVVVGGRIYSLTDSIAEQWVQNGAVDSAMAERIPASPSFLLADTLALRN